MSVPEIRQPLLGGNSPQSTPSSHFSPDDSFIPWECWKLLWDRYESFEGVPLHDSKALESAAMKAARRRDKRQLPVWSVLMCFARKTSISAAFLHQWRPDVATELGQLVRKKEAGRF